MNRKQRRAAARLTERSRRRPSVDTRVRAVPSDLLVLLATGRKLQQVGRIAEAEACYRQFLAAEPNHAGALNLLGLIAYQTGRFDVAIEVIRRAIKLDGKNPGFFSNLGNVLYSQGKFDEAVAAYRQAISINPQFADAYCNLGTALESQGKLDESVAQYRRAININPSFADAYVNLGIALEQQRKPAEAVAALREAIRLNPDDAKAHYNLGVALKECGNFDEVVTANRQAIRLKPDFAEAYFNLGLALRVKGKLDESRDALRKTIELAPTRAVGYRVFADAKQFNSADPHLQSMEKLAQHLASLSPEEQIDLHFALAKAYDDLHEYDRCFSHLLRGNALKRQTIFYDERATLERFRRIRETFTLDLMGRGRHLGYPSQLPVFIIGMPRSGTTLVEQILASHSNLFGAGELNYIGDAVSKLDGGGPSRFPESVCSMPADGFHQFGGNYIDAIRSLAPAAERITDKMPLNFAYVGLIHLALPHARFVHVRRDRLDTCFSCFSKLFVQNQPYSYDLGELGRYYRAYETLMEHWRNVLPHGIMIEVQYEHLIADLEGEARRIVGHCRLEWDNACLSFYETERPVLTASVVQVHQPIYSTSVGRSRPYERLLRPLTEALTADANPILEVSAFAVM